MDQFQLCFKTKLLKYAQRWKFYYMYASTQFSKFCIDYCVPFTKKFPTLNPGSPSEEEGERRQVINPQ